MIRAHVLAQCQVTVDLLQAAALEALRVARLAPGPSARAILRATARALTEASWYRLHLERHCPW